MTLRLFLFSLFLFTGFRSFAADPGDTTIVRFNTSLGPIDVQLFSVEAPRTVANFLNNYVDMGLYTNSIIHRIATQANDGVSVIQGGGFYDTAFPPPPIPTAAPLMNEPISLSNTMGTIAMAKTSDPNSATSQWFFNVTDNTVLDSTVMNSISGGFTVFGVITNASGLAVMQQIAAVPIFTDRGANDGGALTEIPLLNFTSGVPLAQNYVTIYSITTVPPPLSFTTWKSNKLTTAQQSNPNFTSSTAIPWNDGTPNLLKYFCDIDPSVAMSVVNQSKLPTVGKTTIGSTTYLTLSFQQNAASLTDVTYTVQTSSDLQTWTSVTSPTTVEVGSNPTTGDAIMQVQIPVSSAEQFVRLSLIQTGP